MKTHSALLALAVLSNAAIAADARPASHPQLDPKNPTKGSPTANLIQPTSPKLLQKGKVTDIINVPNYTYMEVTQNKKSVWLAAPTTAVEKGDVIRFDDGMFMTNFQSKTLNRNFPSISFVGQVVVTKEKE